MKLKHGLNSAALAIVVATTLSACGHKATEGGSQVAAKVNKDEITVHQINFELGKMQNIPADQAKAAAEQVLQGLVRQQLFVEQAIAAKLDRNPDVVERLDADRRQILAQAYLDSITAKAAAPSDAEIHDYYAKNPQLFSDRRVYKLLELSIPVTKENVDSILDKMKTAATFNEFIDWLKSVGIDAKAVQAIKPAEQIPTEMLANIYERKDGQSIVLRQPDRLNVIQVVGSQSQPVTEAQAKQAIGLYLVNTRKRELVAAETKRLHDNATVEFLGEYSDMAKAGSDKAGQPEAKPAAN